MTLSYFRAYFGYAQSSDLLIVGFADSEHEPSEYMIISREMEPTETRLTHIEISGQQRSAYGGVDAIKLYSRSVEFQFSLSTADALGTREIFAIELRLRDDVLDEIAVVLAEIAGDVFSDLRDWDV